MSELTFTLQIEPRSVQFGNRLGFNRATKRPIFFSDAKKKGYLETVAALATAHHPPAPFQGPLVVDFVFVMPRPKFLMAAKYPDGLIPCPVRPDMDNLRKGTQDALTAFWNNDAQICKGQTEKYYAEKTGKPRIEVSIRALTNPSTTQLTNI